MARIPCQWLYLGGYTFRWGRGDPAIDILRGDTGPVHANQHRIASIPVDRNWDDIRDLKRKARSWLQSTAAQSAASRRTAR